MGILADISGLFGYSDLKEIARDMKRARYKVATATRSALTIQRAMSAAGSQLFCDYLAWEHPELPLLSCAEWTYPVAVFPASYQCRSLTQLQASLELNLKWRPTLRAQAHYFYWLQRTLIDNTNRPTFVLQSFTAEPLHIKVGITDFFSCLRSSQALEWELYQAIGKALETGKYQFEKIKRDLPLRSKLLRGLTIPWANGIGRASAIGLSVVLTYRDGDKRRLFLRRRGPLSIAYHRGRWHVFPSAMFQAPYRHFTTELSVLHCALWEYLEEFFDIQDPLDRKNDPKWFYSAQPVAELIDMLSDGHAEISYAGLVVNPASMRTEIVLILDIHDTDWYSRHQRGIGTAQLFKFSKELASGDDLKLREHALKTPLLQEAAKLLREEGLSPKSIVPVAAGALYLAATANLNHPHPDTA